MYTPDSGLARVNGLPPSRETFISAPNSREKASQSPSGEKTGSRPSSVPRMTRNSGSSESRSMIPSGVTTAILEPSGEMTNSSKWVCIGPDPSSMTTR